AAGGEKRAAPGSRRLAADGFGGPVLETLAGRHRSRLLGFGWPKVGGSRQKGMTAVPLGAKLCQGIFKHSSGTLVSRAVVDGEKPTREPGTGQVIQTVESLSDARLKAKLQKAANTFLSYRKTPRAERSRLMMNAAAVLEKEKAAYARVMTTEMGNTFRSAVDE